MHLRGIGILVTIQAHAKTSLFRIPKGFPHPCPLPYRVHVPVGQGIIPLTQSLPLGGGDYCEEQGNHNGIPRAVR